MNRINQNNKLKKLPQHIKDEISDVIFDRLLADHKLIKNHPEYINDLIDMKAILKDTKKLLLNYDYENAKENIIWIIFNDIVVPESNKISELHLDNSLTEYANDLKIFMESFIK